MYDRELISLSPELKLEKMQSEFIAVNPQALEYDAPAHNAEYYQQMGDRFVENQQWHQAIAAYQQVFKSQS